LPLACLLLLAWPRPRKSAADGIAEYRKMLEDGNPAELFEAKGEDLWKQARGPKNATLERCDLGKGPGVVKGAFVELPRYFADTGKVQDLESRLVTCMETLQGFNAAEIAKTAVRPRRAGQHHRAGDLDRGRVARPALQPAAGPRRRTQELLELASGPSSSAAGRWTSRARPATAKTASASACRTCPT
jgi:hypothetical protein